MNEPENFLTRWSRRKTETKDESTEDAAPAPGAEDPSNDEKDEQTNSDSTAPVQAEASELEFDISTLPPIESIGASTDVTAFLKAGVPGNLARAALRRAWAADPNIRDFVGLSENSWDFTAPDGVPGFGPLTADEASRLMAQFNETLREVAGETKETLERIGNPVETSHSISESSALRAAQKPAPDPAIAMQAPLDQRVSGPDEENLLHRDKETIASHNTPVGEDENSSGPRRGHGSALPK
jgi:Protein of unknown function (DUF3306)